MTRFRMLILHHLGLPIKAAPDILGYGFEPGELETTFQK